MTRDEAKTLIHAMMATYPNYKPSNLSETVDVWTVMLDDVDYLTMQASLKSYIRSNSSQFAPSISQLLDEAEKLTNPNEMEGIEAWGMVKRAMSRSGYYAQEEFSKLPEIIKRTLGSPERLRSMALDEHFNEGVESSNFMRVYNVMKDRAKRDRKLSADLLEIASANNKALANKMEILSEIKA